MDYMIQKCFAGVIFTVPGQFAKKKKEHYAPQKCGAVQYIHVNVYTMYMYMYAIIDIQ